MKRICLNDNWKCFVTGKRDTAIDVTLPYDAMLLDDVCDTYYGEALAVIRPEGKGNIVINATSLNKNLTATATVETI